LKFPDPNPFMTTRIPAAI